MFKSLEVFGFKSFADKTRFEFTNGVTVIIGPNGSGKSNVVDSIKWALGEQKVKSLRGKDSTDIIFNGSVGRKPMNAAEVTLTFDNSRHAFALDLPEVQITRRLLRSGESDYLLNGQSCRLKDIRSLLIKAGIGVQGYCIIEQGKVDALLQSSPRDRRAIFEEAAGISLLNVNTQNHVKRLERIIDNLARIADIIRIEGQSLRALKKQAEKASSYREYSHQLQDLRTFASLVSWTSLTHKINSHQSSVDQYQTQYDQLQASLAEVETHLREEDARLSDMDSGISEQESLLSSLREDIATRESNVSHQLRRLEDLERQESQNRDQAARLGSRTTEQYTRRQTLEQEYAQAKIRRETIARERDDIQTQLEQYQADLQKLEERKSGNQAVSLEKSKNIAALGNEISSLERQLEVWNDHHKNNLQRLEEIDKDVAKSRQAHEQAQIQAQQSIEERETSEEKVQELRLQLEDIRDQYQQRKNVMEAQFLKRTGLRERIAMLEELQNHHDDLTPGIRDVLQQAQENPDGPFGSVIGLAADLFQVSEEAASLIEIALGANAELLVVEKKDERLLQYLKSASAKLSGRVRFLWMDSYWGAFSTPVDLEDQPGVIGRADQFIQTEERYNPLMQRLLGDTWIVESLNDALSLAATAMEPVNYVTLNGERLGADGSIAVGQPQGGSGIIAHRSECRAKKQELEKLEEKLQKHLEEAKRFQEAEEAWINKQNAAEENLETVRQKTMGCIAALTKLEERFVQHRSRREELIRAMVKADSDQKEMAMALQNAKEKKKANEKERERLDRENESILNQARQIREKIEETRKIVTQKKISLAKGEERCQGIQMNLTNNEQDMQSLVQDINRAEQALTECQTQIERVSMAILADQSALANLYLQKEENARKLALQKRERKVVEAARLQFSQSQTALNRQIQTIGGELHGAEMKKENWERELQAIAQRLQEDYNLQLAELASQPIDISSFLLSCLAEGETKDRIMAGRIGLSESGLSESDETPSNEDRRPTETQKSKAHDNTAEPSDTTESDNRTTDEPDSTDDKNEDDDNTDCENSNGEDQQSDEEELERWTITADLLPDSVPSEIEKSMGSVRKLIASLGSVNMEALKELEEKETKFTRLSAQYADMVGNRKDLEKLIEIQKESYRTNFLKTIEDVRSRFNNLFSDLFGGGRAEIILEPNVDILEAGVDIIAQPPGKELSNISLLSGGEKTLTCVALLLAMFELHPSPFCILDEVDAALDEANTDRVCQALRRFQDITQFIAISHSRQTMSIADTLYGVTMQEPGVSKCLSVSMEQVVIKDGDISFAPQSGAA